MKLLYNDAFHPFVEYMPIYWDYRKNRKAYRVHKQFNRDRIGFSFSLMHDEMRSMSSWGGMVFYREYFVKVIL